jgi:hypothetical protein
MRFLFGLLLGVSALLPLCAGAQTAAAPAPPQSAEPWVLPYADAGIGFYRRLDRANPSYNADAGVDLLHKKLLVEVEGGGDTADASRGSDGHTFRLHGLAFYRIASRWRLGAGVHFSEFSSSTYKKRDLWPTVAAMYEHDWLRANIQYLLPGTNHDYRETGPLVDLRFHLIKNFYFRQRSALLFYRDALESPPGRHVGSELTFGVLYEFHRR